MAEYKSVAITLRCLSEAQAAWLDALTRQKKLAILESFTTEGFARHYALRKTKGTLTRPVRVWYTPKIMLHLSIYPLTDLVRHAFIQAGMPKE
jgi:hypothetical protein